MGRDSRQARRARDRREQSKRKEHTDSGAVKWSMFFGIGVAVAAVLIFGIIFLASNTVNGSGSSTPPPLPTATPGRPIDGIGCNQMEQNTYHVHSHLEILVNGQSKPVPNDIGHNYNHDCLYWLHSHNVDGVIHIEAPKVIHPTLKTYFDIWGQPISGTRVAHYVVKPGEQMKVIVNGVVYRGDPANIPLGFHKNISIEIGGPFSPQQSYSWGQL